MLDGQVLEYDFCILVGSLADREDLVIIDAGGLCVSHVRTHVKTQGLMNVDWDIVFESKFLFQCFYSPIQRGIFLLEECIQKLFQAFFDNLVRIS